MPAPHRSPWRVDPAVAARILALTRFNLGPHQLAWPRVCPARRNMGSSAANSGPRPQRPAAGRVWQLTWPQRRRSRWE